MANLIPTTQDTFYGPSIHQSYDVYRHSVRDPGGNPVIIYRHGGGWWSNDKRDIGVDSPQNASYRLATYLLSRTAPTDTHFDIISIESRQKSFSSSGATFGYAQPNDMPSYFPEAWDDVKLAIVHIKQNAASLGIDPKKVVLLGNSAGATTLWWSQLTAPLIVDGVDSRALAMMFEKPLVDLRIKGGTGLYSSASVNYYDFAFGTNAGVGAYPTTLPTATQNAASIAWYYETGQLQYAIPTMVLSYMTDGSFPAYLQGSTTIGAISGTPFSSWTTSDKISISAGQSRYLEASPGITNLGYIAGYSQGGVYPMSVVTGNTITLGTANGRNRITFNAGTAATVGTYKDGMELTSTAFASYVHKDGDLLWISTGSTNDVVLSKTSGSPATVMGNAGAYRITGRILGTNTITIDRSCLRGTPSVNPTVSGAIYPVDFAGLSGGSATNWVNVTVKRIPATPYADVHDSQQYASMESLMAQQQDTALLSFVPFFQYDGDLTAPFIDYRHSSAMYEFAASAVKGRPTALSSTLVGAQVG